MVLSLFQNEDRLPGVKRPLIAARSDSRIASLSPG